MTKKIYVETLKSVLGRSILHYLCLSWLKNNNKKEEISSYLLYNFVSLGKLAGKAAPFSWR